MSDRPTPRMTTREGRAAFGYGWQDNGPVLSNLTPRLAHRYYWSVIEAIVWIATRDLNCVGGARTYLSDGADPMDRLDHNYEPRPWHADVAAQVLLSVHLKNDLAGHHRDCPRLSDEGTCSCAKLGRRRYCRCEHPELTNPILCGCVPDAREALFGALVQGMAATGQREGETIYEEIRPAAFAGARPEFREGDGLSIIPEYHNIRILRSEIEKRWPPDPEPVTDEDSQDKAYDELADLMSGPAFNGRPPDWVEGILLFIDRLTAAEVTNSQTTEAGIIAKAHSKQPGRSTVAKWIRPYFNALNWRAGIATNAVDIAASAKSDLTDRLRKKRGVHKR